MNKKLLKKLAVGTVQFGAKYGINKKKIPIEDIKKILINFKSIGSETIDTSPLYGGAEKILGNYSPKKNNFQYITKIPKINNNKISDKQIYQIKKFFFNSLKNLKKKNIYGLLIHSTKDIFKPGGNKLIDLLLFLKKKKIVRKIGISVYSKEEINNSLKKFRPDIIQIPLNLLDRRMIKNKYLSKLKKKNIEIHARSLFLQGILTSKKNFFPFKNKKDQKQIIKIKNNILKQNISLINACIYFGLQQKELDKLIIGFSSYRDFTEVMNSFNYSYKEFKFKNKFKINNEKILNPSNWK
tara:strand:- start:1280 stop:2170 length:891 start_codon:yes stop_codon:yes gene_type:complete